MNCLLDVNWLALGRLVLGIAASILFFRLYAAHDYREIAIRLLRNTYKGEDGADLNHTGRHAVRLGFCVLLGVAIGGLSWASIPAVGAVAGAGYLIFDPALNKDRSLPWDYSGTGNKWDKFWLKLTNRSQPAERWSAYVELVLLLAMISWYCYTTRTPGYGSAPASLL